MRLLPPLALGAGIALFATSAEAQYFYYFSSRSAEPSYTSTLVNGRQKTEGPIKRAYINKYGHVVVTERSPPESGTGPGDPVTSSPRPAPQASRR